MSIAMPSKMLRSARKFRPLGVLHLVKNTILMTICISIWDRCGGPNAGVPLARMPTASASPKSGGASRNPRPDLTRAACFPVGKEAIIPTKVKGRRTRIADQVTGLCSQPPRTWSARGSTRKLAASFPGDSPSRSRKISPSGGADTSIRLARTRTAPVIFSIVPS